MLGDVGVLITILAVGIVLYIMPLTELAENERGRSVEYITEHFLKMLALFVVILEMASYQSWDLLTEKTKLFMPKSVLSGLYLTLWQIIIAYFSIRICKKFTHTIRKIKEGSES